MYETTSSQEQDRLKISFKYLNLYSPLLSFVFRHVAYNIGLRALFRY